MWWIKKSQSIPAISSSWLITGPWFTFFSWWIPYAATPWYFMRSSTRNRFTNPILLILVGSFSLLWWDPLWLQDQLLIWGKLWKIKLQLLFRKILASLPAPRTADGYSRYSKRKERCSIYISEISGPDHKKRKDNLKKFRSCCEECGNPVCEKHSNLICHNPSE